MMLNRLKLPLQPLTLATNWDNIKNLQDLMTSTCTYSIERRLKDVLYIKCKACSAVVYSPEGIAYQSRLKRHDTFTYGLMIPKATEPLLFDGQEREWVLWKSKLKTHFQGSDSNSDMHWKGLHLIKTARDKESRLLKINKSFIIACIDVIKSKSAAVHFETKLSSLQALGVDIGNKQHSRKQFKGIVDL